MESYRMVLVLALGMAAFGLYTLIRAWRISRSADSAWYGVENRRVRNTALNWGLQAVVLFVAGASLLIWIALGLRSPNPGEGLPVPSRAVWPSSTNIAPSPTVDVVLPATSTPPATVQPPPEGDAQTLIPIPTLVLGSQAVVTNTGGGGLWMRDAPFGNGLILLPEGAVVFVRGGLVEVEDLIWQSVSDADGREGWVAADYLIYR